MTLDRRVFVGSATLQRIIGVVTYISVVIWFSTGGVSLMTYQVVMVTDASTYSSMTVPHLCQLHTARDAALNRSMSLMLPSLWTIFDLECRSSFYIFLPSFFLEQMLK